MRGLLGSPRLNHSSRHSPITRSIQTFCGLVVFVLTFLLFLSPPQKIQEVSSILIISANPNATTSHVGASEPVEPLTTQKITVEASLGPIDPEPAPSVYPPLPPPDTAERVAFCMVIKNQSIDMPEFFIHHYYHHGVRRFYIYDDGSEPPLSSKPYIDSWGIPDSAINFRYIHPEDVKDRQNFQVDTYTDCIRRFGPNHTWIATLDPDEFLEMRGTNPPTLLEWLDFWNRNASVGALGVHWLGHHSDGHLKKQPGDVRKAYKTCVGNAPDKSNKHVKTFVKTQNFDYIENIHWAKTNNGTIEVAEHGDKIHTWMHSPITHDTWALHHYATKSREDYELKKSRHRVEGGNLTDWWWDEMHNSGNVSCPELAAYIP